MSKTVQGRNGAHSRNEKERKSRKTGIIIVVIEILFTDSCSSAVCLCKLSKIEERHKLQ